MRAIAEGQPAGSRMEGSPELTQRLCATSRDLMPPACSCERVRAGAGPNGCQPHLCSWGCLQLPLGENGLSIPLLFRYHVNVSLKESRLGPLAEREPGNPNSQI